MTQRVYKSCSDPLRGKLSWEERWKGPDGGLITCWETGRELRNKEPDLSERAKSDELPVLGWKGGVEKRILKKQKYGTFYFWRSGKDYEGMI